MPNYVGINPIALKSQNWIIEAMLHLMSVMPYKRITIKNITEKAELDRRTFYRNFASKEDVLKTYIKTIGDEYVAELLKEEVITIPISLRVFFEFAEQYKDFLLQLKKNDLLMLLLSNLNEILPSMHVLVEDKFFGFDDFDNENIQYAFLFNVGGFWNILISWLNDSSEKSPHEIADIINRLVSKTTK